MAALNGYLGIIGGSGLYAIDGFQSKKEHRVKTPFGTPSDAIIEGKLHGKKVFFMPRHGRGHRFLPSEINYRANIYALKKLGVRTILAVSAVGSLQERFRPGHFVLVDQFIDRTKGIRESTFFGAGMAGHVSMAEPTCKHLFHTITDVAEHLPLTLNVKGTYVCIEGPNFSTRAESTMNHDAGFSVVGMTNVPEAYLAREAGICYCTLAMITDYDCWNENEEAVNVETVVATMKESVARAKQLISKLVEHYEPDTKCSCRSASEFAVMTEPKAVPAKTKTAMKLILQP